MALTHRILKNLGAMFTGRAISIIQQLIVPPVFIARYGTARFGEWGVLSGAIAALSILNFGVQTYMNQDLAVRWNRGETDGYHLRQSSALRLLSAVILAAAILCLGIFVLPLDTLLRLDISRHAAQLTLYLLALQVLLNILFGYFAGIFMGIALAHRGAHWNNAQSFIASISILIAIAFHASFPVLAATQLASLLICTVGVLIDIRRTEPRIFPTIRHWDRATAISILKPSGYFGLIAITTFLVYQAPLLILQRIVGPVAVAGFILMRTIFSMCRQVLAIFTQSMGAEITNLFGRQDWPLLTRLYLFSERFIFFLISVVNVTVLMLSPVLITLWLHKKAVPGHPSPHINSLFAITPYVLASAISMVISLKEHKLQFQFSTNTHVQLARLMFFSYIAMVAISGGTIHFAGVTGFLWTWLAFELLQTGRLIQLNVRLFAHVQKLESTYVLRLFAVCTVSLGLAVLTLQRTMGLPLLWQTAIAALAGLLVAAVTWPLFHVREVASVLLARFGKRFA